MWLRLLTAIFFSALTSAAQALELPGNYTGVLGPLHLQLHLQADADGALSGTLDSVDQQTNGLFCTNFHFNGKALAFDVPSVGGKWRGTVSDDGVRLG
jgi:serine-type D-Ala-D-Ala carboxypeptidase/endopeptidase